MPAEYRKIGIAFQYPENWTLDENDAVAGHESVTVYSPGGAFWSVSIHPFGTDPKNLAKAAVKALEEEYKELESEQAQEMIGGHELTGYDLNFYFLDLTNTAAVRCFFTPLATYAIFFQAEDREFEQIQQVFRAMTTSFLQNVK